MFWMWRGLNKFEVFPGFLGNERAAQTLFQAIDNQEIAHTLLFTGPAGCGKKTLAEKATQKLFCQDMCGECKNCKMLARGIHPDFLLIVPEGDSLKLEQARQVKAFLSTPPNTATYKVAVLDNCQQLTIEAANSLLKILEEPPSPSVCILTADSADNLLPTLVSRSQVYHLTPLPPFIVNKELIARNAPAERAEFLAEFTGGVLGKALTLLEDQEFWQLRKNVVREIQEVFGRNRDPLLSAENWHGMPERILDITEYWLRDMLMLQTIPAFAPVNRDLRPELEACTRACPLDKTIVLLDECVQARERLASRCNARLVFDSLLLKMWEV